MESKNLKYTFIVGAEGAKYGLYQNIFVAYLHDSLLIEHRDKKHMGFVLLSLLLLFLACTIGVDMLIIGFPMLALAAFLPNMWVLIKANRAHAKVELEDSEKECWELQKDE